MARAGSTGHDEHRRTVALGLVVDLALRRRHKLAVAVDGACGEPLTRLEYQTILAWTLHVNVAAVGFKYGQAIAHGNPIVLFTPIPRGGWKVQAVNQRAPACLRLPQ